MKDSRAYQELVSAVGTLCLVSADQGTAPDDLSLHKTLWTLVEAVVDEERVDACAFALNDVETTPTRTVPVSDHDCDRDAVFDRTLCPEPCGSPHYYCGTCSRLLSVCALV